MNPPLRERLRWAGQEPTPADASADRAVMARSFVYLYGAGSLLSFATLLLPHASDRWAPGVALIGAAAGTVAGAAAVAIGGPATAVEAVS